jgi:hypothetical protein
MLRTFRERLADSFVFGIYFFTLLIAARAGSREAMQWALAAVAGIAFVAWLLSLRRRLAIADTPTSKIASAAQGYVELVGQGRHQPEFQVLSHLTHLPCLWFRYVVEERTGNNKWRRVASGRSQESFLLDDGTGVCVVDPEHAEVVPRKQETWTRGDYRYTEWLILLQDTVYAIGEFTTIGGANTELDIRGDVTERLAQWKRNQPQLLERFDLDGDGAISEKEWLLARSQARREVHKEHNAIRTQSGTHVLRKPRDGRLFLISNIAPASLARRYRILAWVHLVVLLGAIAAWGWVMQRLGD